MGIKMIDIDLVFDTETTGMVMFNSPYNHPDQPDIVQLAACLSQGDYVLGEINFLIKPDKAVHPKAQEAHGITPEIIEMGAVSRRVALLAFSQMMRKCTRLVAHNIQFDMKIILAAFDREGATESILLTGEKKSFCTMLESTQVCKIPSTKKPGSYKWPSLQEGYRLLVNPEGFQGAHNASVDVRACLAILRALDKRAA
jgi:DNA polymerase-3 subunit epsilon